MAVEGDFPTILSVLLENGADPDQMDEEGNIGRSHRVVSSLVQWSRTLWGGVSLICAYVSTEGNFGTLPPWETCLLLHNGLGHTCNFFLGRARDRFIV